MLMYVKIAGRVADIVDPDRMHSVASGPVLQCLSQYCICDYDKVNVQVVTSVVTVVSPC